MYLAQLNTFQSQAPFYINIFENILSGKIDKESKETIDYAILEAIDVAKGNKNVFSIDNNHYFLITTLLKKYKDSLLDIGDKDFENQTYSDIIELLK